MAESGWKGDDPVNAPGTLAVVIFALRVEIDMRTRMGGVNSWFICIFLHTNTLSLLDMLREFQLAIEKKSIPSELRNRLGYALRVNLSQKVTPA
jgi:hypothetical protein